MNILISDHTYEKHLYNISYTGVSFFFSKTVLLNAVQLCLDSPDRQYTVGRRAYFLKQFSFYIGVLGINKQLSNKVKVVCVRNGTKFIVVTAFPDH